MYSAHTQVYILRSLAIYSLCIYAPYIYIHTVCDKNQATLIHLAAAPDMCSTYVMQVPQSYQAIIFNRSCLLP